MAATAVTLPSPGTHFPVATTTSPARRRLLLPTPSPRRALRVVAAAATEAPPKVTPPPTTPSGIVLVDPAEAQKVHRLKAVYEGKVVPLITEEFGYTNAHQVLDTTLSTEMEAVPSVTWSIHRCI
jgi:large subunit ribosomal protein L5